MLDIELSKRNISSNIDILGEGELRNDEVQDANGTNICHVCTAIIKTTFQICDSCNNSINEDCCEPTSSLATCYSCIVITLQPAILVLVIALQPAILVLVITI